MATQTTVKVLTQGVQLTASAVVEYTTPANTTTLIKKVTVTNTTGSAATITVYKVASAGTPSASNTLVSAQVIPAGSVVELYAAENHALATGDTIQALSGTAAALTLMVSGIEIQ